MIRLRIWRGIVYSLLAISVTGFLLDYSAVEENIWPLLMLLGGMAVVSIKAVNYMGAELVSKTTIAIVIVYFWIAFPIKVIAIHMAPEKNGFFLEPFSSLSFVSSVDDNFLILAPALILFILGFCVPVPLKTLPKFRDMVLRHRMLLRGGVVLAALLVLRYLAQAYLKMGIPGVEPVALGVPLIAGSIAILFGMGLMVAINIYLFLALRHGIYRDIILALTLVMANIYLDLRVGLKGGLVFQSFLITYYAVVFRRYLKKGNYRVIVVSAVVLLIALISIYKYVNLYRFQVISGLDPSEAIDEMAGMSLEEKSFFWDFYNRINGIDAYSAAIGTIPEGVVEFGGLLSGGVVRAFKEVIYGSAYADRAISAVGATQFAALQLVGGVPGLYFGSFILGLMFRGISRALEAHVAWTKSLYMAFMPILAIWTIKTLFAGGNLVLYMKELIVIVILIVFVSRRLTKDFAMRRVH